MSDVFLAVLDIEDSDEILELESPSESLARFSKNLTRIHDSGFKMLKKEKSRFGGNPLPWEPGGEVYFDKISE